MVALPRLTGFELPVYDPDTELITPGRDGVEGPNTTVVRTITVHSDFAFLSLKRLLDKTDQELERAADICKARVVPHSWGLIKKNTGRYFINGHEEEDTNIMPLGYSLVAEVNVILPKQKPLIPALACAKKLNYRSARYNKLRGLRHSDIYPRQLLYGVDLEEVKQHGQAKAQDWLVDIDPYFTKK